MKKIILLIFINLISISLANAKSLTIITNNADYKYIKISKSDTSRIKCTTGKIGEIVYSKDKEMNVKKLKDNAFIKLKPVIGRSNGVVISKSINTFNRELYLECNKKMYSFILVPSEIPAQTIVITDPYKKEKKAKVDIKKATKLEEANDFETTLSNLIKKAYKEEVPSGYTLEQVDKVVADFQELTLVHSKIYNGNNYNINVYIIKAKKDLRNIEEKVFLDYVEHPLAITLTKHNFHKNESARLLVISNNNAPRYTTKEKNTMLSKAIINLEIKKNRKALKRIEAKHLVSDRIKKFIGTKNEPKSIKQLTGEK